MLLPKPKFALLEEVTYIITVQRGIITMCYRTPEKVFYDVLDFGSGNLLVKIDEDKIIKGHALYYDDNNERWVMIA